MKYKLVGVVTAVAAVASLGLTSTSTAATGTTEKIPVPGVSQKQWLMPAPGQVVKSWSRTYRLIPGSNGHGTVQRLSGGAVPSQAAEDCTQQIFQPFKNIYGYVVGEATVVCGPYAIDGSYFYGPYGESSDNGSGRAFISHAWLWCKTPAGQPRPCGVGYDYDSLTRQWLCCGGFNFAGWSAHKCVANNQWWYFLNAGMDVLWDGDSYVLGVMNTQNLASDTPVINC